MGKKSGSRRRVVQDQASSCLIVGDPWRPYEADPTSAPGRHFSDGMRGRMYVGQWGRSGPGSGAARGLKMDPNLTWGTRSPRQNSCPKLCGTAYNMLVEVRRRLPKVEASNEAPRVHRRLLRERGLATCCPRTTTSKNISCWTPCKPANWRGGGTAQGDQRSVGGP